MYFDFRGEMEAGSDQVARGWQLGLWTGCGCNRGGQSRLGGAAVGLGGGGGGCGVG